MKQPVPSLHVTPALHRALAGCLALPALFMAAHAAGFTGDFAVTPPGNGVHYSSLSLGKWTGTVVQASDLTKTAWINTIPAPGLISLHALPNETVPIPSNRGGSLQGAPIGSLAELTIAAPAAGTFTVSYQLNLFGAVASYLEGGTWTTFNPNETSISLILDQGEVFGFRIENDTTFAQSGRGAALAAGGEDSLTLLNPTFEPVPEASTVAAGLALAGLAGWSCFRARRRA